MLYSKALQANAIERYQIKESLIILVSAILLPYLIHLLPAVGNVPTGAHLLPMFYAPFIAAVLFRYHVGLSAAALAPVLNYFVMGMPVAGLVPVLTIEVVLFFVISKALNQVYFIRYVNAPLSYIFVKAISACLLFMFSFLVPGKEPLEFFTSSVMNALPGLFTLLAINIFILKIRAE